MGFHECEEFFGWDRCCCSCRCCEWSLGKMKQLVADKLVVSLLGDLNKREEDATTWHCLLMFWGTWILGNLDGEEREEEREVDDFKKTHWHQLLLTLACSKTSCRLYPSNKFV